MALNAPRNTQSVTDSHGKAVIPITTFKAGARTFGVRDGRDDSTGESFEYPDSAVIKATGPIEGRVYSLRSRPISWITYYIRRRGLVDWWKSRSHDAGRLRSRRPQH